MQITEILPGIVLFENALHDADVLHEGILGEVSLSQEHMTFGTRVVAMPRLTAWYGDSGAFYTYSGIRNEPKPWTPVLLSLRERLDARLGTNLNSCLLNYADGSNSIGWHRDNEPELCDRIVSVSLGAERTFMLREGRNGEVIPVVLQHGSVLVMTIASQQAYYHCVPKEEACGSRLNLTFRTVNN